MIIPMLLFEGTLVGYPVMAAIVAGIISLIM